MDLKIVLTTTNENIKQHYLSFINKNSERGDSGLDLPMVSSGSIQSGEKAVLMPLGVKIFAFRNGMSVPYYLCPRSSLPLKAPLRLANSIGVIDAGYRGELKAIVDHVGETTDAAFHYKVGDRFFQVVSPTLEPHKSIELVDDIESYRTERNEGGFGSTGTTS